MKKILPVSTKLNVKQLYIGILSGTSMNSIDAALVQFINNKCKILEKTSCKFNKKLLKTLLNIINTNSTCSLLQIGELDQKIGLSFAKAVKKLLIKAKVNHKSIIAIGCHGQNLWHAADHRLPFTIQIGDPNIICNFNKIITVTDFRRKDISLGGQGAPLAPGFHSTYFRSTNNTRAIINIGGITNITILPRKTKLDVIGFDLGPGNCLMDEWVQLKFKKNKINYDKNGLLASSGKVIPELLNILLQDPYFKKNYPKSTGREYFNQNWLQQKIFLFKKTTLNKVKYMHPRNILATLLYLTAYIIKNNIIMLNNMFKKLSLNDQIITEIYLCGGGAKNLALLSLLKDIIPCSIKLTNDLGVDSDWVEAALFAWLAKQTMHNLPGNLPTVTGAKSPGVLGGIYLP